MPNDLIAVIRQKQAAIAKLQAELDEARELLAGEARKPSGPAAPKATQAVVSRRLKGSKRGTKSRGKPRSADLLGVRGLMPTGSTARAVDVLREAGKPMYVIDIIREIETRYGEKVKKDTLVGNISRYIKAEKLFYRTGPNVYGLLAMKAG